MNYKDLTKKHQQEIGEVLDQFGLNDKEQAVYLAMLGTAESTMTPLARQLDLPATTVQAILARLEQKGLVSVTKIKTRQAYSANDPAVLKKIIEANLEEAKNIIPLLQKLQGNEQASARIKIYHRERMADIFHEALACQDKMIYEVVSARHLQHILGEKFHFTKRRVANSIKLKSLRVEKHEIKKYSKAIHERELREAKFLPQEMDFSASYLIWDNKVAFFTTKTEGLAWVVDSPVIAVMMRQTFELLWSVSRKMETA